MEIQMSQYIRPKVTVHKGAETIQGRKLFKGGNYMRKYGIYILWISCSFRLPFKLQNYSMVPIIRINPIIHTVGTFFEIC